MRAPVLAVRDGALGFWAAVRDVFPQTLWQRDRVHKTSNVLGQKAAIYQLGRGNGILVATSSLYPASPAHAAAKASFSHQPCHPSSATPEARGV
jgi:hypothetical protein